jgi:hypothetical protein
VAAIMSVETGWTFDPGITSASGHMGLGQFDTPTWLATPQGAAGSSPFDPRAAISGIAEALCQKGWAANPKRALFAYSGGATWYPGEVEARAVTFGAFVSAPSFASLPALNQFDRANYSSAAAYATWHTAACSAAALTWLADAYGHPLRAIDQAIALYPSGISPTLGLLDHTGSALAGALQELGLTPRRLQVTSDAQLRQQIAAGPLLLDGQGWFGEGHWFVAYGSDAGGISIRDSSGHDVQYLGWAQLHGEVGFSGWVVGVASAPPANAA